MLEALPCPGRGSRIWDKGSEDSVFHVDLAKCRGDLRTPQEHGPSEARILHRSAGPAGQFSVLEGHHLLASLCHKSRARDAAQDITPGPPLKPFERQGAEAYGGWGQSLIFVCQLPLGGTHSLCKRWDRGRVGRICCLCHLCLLCSFAGLGSTYL